MGEHDSFLYIPNLGISMEVEGGFGAVLHLHPDLAPLTGDKIDFVPGMTPVISNNRLVHGHYPGKASPLMFPRVPIDG